MQRAEQEAAMGPGGDARERAMLKRDKTLPKRKDELTVAVSSSKPPPPPPGGAAAVQFNTARAPRAATVNRPLSTAPQPLTAGRGKLTSRAGVRSADLSQHHLRPKRAPNVQVHHCFVPVGRCSQLDLPLTT